MSKTDNKKHYWLDQPRNINRIVYALWLICAGLLIAEFFYHKHPHFGWDGWFGFYALFGFVAYCFIVLTAKGLRRLIRRDEDYYSDGLGSDGLGSDGLGSDGLGTDGLGDEGRHDDV